MTKSLTTIDLKTKLIYSHGIEIENHLALKDNGTVLVGNNLLILWNTMFEKAYEYLKDLKDKKKAPPEILAKIVKIEVEEVDKHERVIKFVFIHYKLGKETIKVNVFGPDPNISQITWLLELVTPPCEYLEELEWWIAILYEAAMVGLKNQEPKVVLFPIGLSPMEERFRSGLSCGSHHHIGISDKKEKIAVYNMFRNFVPHLIALSASSPFINQAPKGTPKIREINGHKQVIGRFTHSNRLANNTGQIGPNIPEYLPILKDTDGKEQFSQYVKKTPPDDRMVDVYPFTDYNTIELRFFDAQPFSENRLATVLLLQALALKAKSLVKNKTPVPTINSSILFENRQKSIEMGLLAQFSIDGSTNSDFSNFYNFNVITGKKATRLLDSTTSMILYLKDELQQFNRLDIVNYLLVPVLGKKDFEPPFAISDYLISLYEQNHDILNLFSKLYYQNPSQYSLVASGALDSLVVSENKEGELQTPVTNLSSKLKQDLQSRRKESVPQQKIDKPEVKTKISAKKVSSKKVSSKKPKKQPTKAKQPTIEVKTEIKKKTEEIQSVESVSESVESEPELPVAETQEITASLKGRVPISSRKPEAKKKKTVISAFDKIEEEDLYIPAIEIEAKYTKIESKIANVMRKRREEIEQKKKELYKEHLEKDRTEFKPAIKSVKFNFPTQISGSNIFGYIMIEWQKNSIYKLRNNPIYFYLSANTVQDTNKKQLKTISMQINVQRSSASNSSKIPLFFSVEELQGDMIVEILAVTGTNEHLFTDTIKFKRNDEIDVKYQEFYVNGDFGPVECTFAMMSNVPKLKGNFDLILAIPDYDDVSINSSSLSLDQNQVFQNFNFVDLDALYHGAPFYLVAQTTVGRLKKTNSFEAIRIKPTDSIVVQWDILTDEGKPDFTNTEKKKSKFDLKFLFNFTKELPPITIEIFMNTLPEGSTKTLVKSDVKRIINENDGYLVSKTIKIPKNCEYIYFDVEITTKKGFIPIDLISDPIGYPVN